MDHRRNQTFVRTQARTVGRRRGVDILVPSNAQAVRELDCRVRVSRGRIHQRASELPRPGGQAANTAPCARTDRRTIVGLDDGVAANRNLPRVIYLEKPHRFPHYVRIRKMRSRQRKWVASHPKSIFPTYRHCSLAICIHPNVEKCCSVSTGEGDGLEEGASRGIHRQDKARVLISRPRQRRQRRDG